MIEIGLRGHVGEGAISIVVVERVVVQTGDKQIRMTVVVVVGDGDAVVIAGSGQSGSIGNIGEGALPIVAEEAIPVFARVFPQGGDVCPIGEEDVGAAVAVVVEDRDTACHALGSVLARGRVVLQTEGDSFERETDRLGRLGRTEQQAACRSE